MVSASDYNRPILVKSNSPEFILTLPSNPSTGYSWFLMDYNGQLIQPESYKFKPNTSKKVGAPGQSIWVFELEDSAFTVPQLLKITLIYARPWDLTGSKQKTITVMTQP